MTNISEKAKTVGAVDVVIMAAGKGTRMKSKLPKVLHLLAGRPLLQHVVDTAAQLSARQVVVVTGHGAIEVEVSLAYSTGATGKIDHYFSRPSVTDIVGALEADADEWAQHTAAVLRKRSPLMLHVVLEQIRRARTMSLAYDLRMERVMVRHCFHTHHLVRSARQSETVEGIRALAVDKDHTPRWDPPRIEDVTPAMVAPFFNSPWTPQSHPLRELT